MNNSFTQKDILTYLEETDQETYHFFIDFEHPYFHTAGSRLTLYADQKRWAIVFEKSGYNNAADRCEIELAYFGNCLINIESENSPEGYTSNVQTIILIDNEEIERIEDNMNGLVSSAIQQVKVRNILFDVEQDIAVYEKKDITDNVHENAENLISIISLIRYLDEQYSAMFRSTGAERRKCLPEDLPELMQIEEWYHEAYTKYEHFMSPTKQQYEILGKKPGDYETYKMIADVLVSMDTTKWKPTLRPNSNWRNWPEAGYM